MFSYELELYKRKWRKNRNAMNWKWTRNEYDLPIRRRLIYINCGAAAENQNISNYLSSSSSLLLLVRAGFVGFVDFLAGFLLLFLFFTFRQTDFRIEKCREFFRFEFFLSLPLSLCLWVAWMRWRKIKSANKQIKRYFSFCHSKIPLRDAFAVGKCSRSNDNGREKVQFRAECFNRMEQLCVCDVQICSF